MSIARVLAACSSVSLTLDDCTRAGVWDRPAPDPSTLIKSKCYDAHVRAHEIVYLSSHVLISQCQCNNGMLW